MEVEDVKLEPDDYDSLGEDTISINVENDLEHLIALPGKHGKIRRPPNAFMLFARDHRRSISVTNPYVPNKQISSILGNQWRNLNPDQKRGYYDKARALDSAHKQQYPNYVYNPKEARERKKSRQLLKRSRKLQGLSKFGKEKQYRYKGSMAESYFDDSKNSSFSSDKKETIAPYNELKPMPGQSVSPVYVAPNVCSKYPLSSAMDDPPADELADTRRHMMTFLSEHSPNGKNASPATQNGSRSTNAMPLPSSSACDNNNGFEPCNLRTSSPLTSTESLASKSQTNSDSSLPFAVTDSSSSAKTSRGCDSKSHVQLDKTPGCQYHCKWPENQRASTSSGIRMHCACTIPAFPVFEGSCHPPSPPISHHYTYSRPYMSPYMGNPYNVHPIYPLPYIPMSQASSETPSMHPNVYHSPPPPVNMYHPSGTLYGARYYPYMNGDHLQRDDYLQQRFPNTSCRMADYHNRGRHPGHAVRPAESPIAEDDEEKESETDRPPSNTSLNNSSSNLVIVTDNFENN